jgi:hypothetical protein
MRKVLDIVWHNNRAWLWLGGWFVTLSIFYGFGSHFVENNKDWPWWARVLHVFRCFERQLAEHNNDGHRWTVVPVYVVAAIVLGLCTAWWVGGSRRVFLRAQKTESWQDELQATSAVWAYCVIGAGLGTLLPQILLIVLYRPNGPVAWLTIFAILSSVVASGGAYFFMGYPGMVNLERLEERLRRLAGDANLATVVPRALISSLEAELGMLRILIGGIVSLYVVGTVTMLLSLDKIPSLLGHKDKDMTFANLPVAEQIWFICGVALLLVACHALVAGPVWDQHSRIMLWLRHATTEGEKGPQ